MNLALKTLFLTLLFPTLAVAKVKVAFIEGFSGADPHTARELYKGSEAFLESDPEAAKYIEVVKYDLGGSVADAAVTIQKALKDGIKIFIGAGKSDDAIAAAKILDGRAILITPFATNKKVTEGKSTVFRVCFSDEAQGEGLAELARNTLKSQKTVILRNIQSSYSVGLSETFAKYFKRKAELIEYSGDTLDASKLSSLVLNHKPDLVFIPDHITRASVIAKAINSKDKSVEFLGGDGFGGQKIFLGVMGAEKNIKLVYSTHWYPEIEGTRNKTFKAAYKKLYPADVPTSGAAMSFDAFSMLNESLKGTNYQADVPKLVSLLETKTFISTVGPISFPKSSDHSPQKPIVFLQYQEGKYGIMERKK